MRNTHSAFIVGDNFSAFIDGIPNDHECNSNGDMVYESASGKRIYWHTYKQWASYTHTMREPLIYAYHDAISDPITMGSCSCSICKSPAIDGACWL